MIAICFVNQKGGVGKILIDFDPQESLSYWLGVDQPARTSFDYFEGIASLIPCKTIHSEGFDFIPFNEMLATIAPVKEEKW